MSMGFIKNGKYVQVAGNPPPSGELVTGASTIRKGTAAGTTSYGYVQGTVTFDSPMPDADYEVTISFSNIAATHHTWMLIDVFEKTATGFKYSIRDTAYSDSEASTAQAIACTFNYTAFKLYTVEGVEELEADVATLKSSVSAIGNYGYSGIKTINITGGSTSAVQLATTVKLSAGKTYLLGLHVVQNPTDGACTVTITNASGTGISYWENSIDCPIGRCKLGQSFPVKLAEDTTLGIKVTPWQASTGNWDIRAEISWTQLS